MRPAAPLTRGWTHVLGGELQHRLGCPAHAGMDPRKNRDKERKQRLPRSRGDGPTVNGLLPTLK